MMTETSQRDLIEIYRLHAELADKVSQRREGANRLYVSLLVGLVVFLAAVLRFGIVDESLAAVMWLVGAVGVSLSISWAVVIRSYRQLNDGKFLALHELEEKLPYPFFKREWELLDEGRSAKRYWKLTTVEVALPVIFFLLSWLLIVAAFLR